MLSFMGAGLDGDCLLGHLPVALYPVAGLLEPLLPAGGVQHPWPVPEPRPLASDRAHGNGRVHDNGHVHHNGNGHGLSTSPGQYSEPDAAEQHGQPNAPSEHEHRRRGIPDHILDRAYACAQCGYCRDVCTLYSGRGWESASPRGKWYFLREYAEGKLPFTQEMVDTFLLCTTCKRCDDACQLGLPIQSTWDELRGVLVQDKDVATFPAFEMMGGSFLRDQNISPAPDAGSPSTTTIASGRRSSASPGMWRSSTFPRRPAGRCGRASSASAGRWRWPRRTRPGMPTSAWS